MGTYYLGQVIFIVQANVPKILIIVPVIIVIYLLIISHPHFKCIHTIIQMSYIIHWQKYLICITTFLQYRIDIDRVAEFSESVCSKLKFISDATLLANSIIIKKNNNKPIK